MTKEDRAIVITQRQADLILAMTGNVDWLGLVPDMGTKVDICNLRVYLQSEEGKIANRERAWDGIRKAQAAVMDAQNGLKKAQDALEKLDDTQPMLGDAALLEGLYAVKDGSVNTFIGEGIIIMSEREYNRQIERFRGNGER